MKEFADSKFWRAWAVVIAAALVRLAFLQPSGGASGPILALDPSSGAFARDGDDDYEVAGENLISFSDDGRTMVVWEVRDLARSPRVSKAWIFEADRHN